MSDASKFKDSEGTLVNVKDAQARADIATINSSLAQYIKAHTFTTATTTSGTVFTCALTCFYTPNGIINVAGRVILQNVDNGTRPTITLTNKPSDFPNSTFGAQFISSLTRRGTNADVISDPYYLSINNNNPTLTGFNFAGATPAGWLDINF